MNKYKLIRVSTVPVSLNILLKGQLSFLNQYFDVTAISSSGSDLKVVAEREKVGCHSIEIKRNIAIFADFISLCMMYRYLKRTKPMIVHSITPKAGLITMIASKLAGVPIRMHTFTGLIFPTKKGIMQQILILMDKLLCICATNIYPEGEGVKNDLQNYKITKKALKIIANGNVNGIDTDVFNKNNISKEEKQKIFEKLKISNNDFVFVFVGRLVKDKGVNELIQAFKQISSYKNVHLLLVGEREEDLDPLDDNTLLIMKNHPQIHEVGFQLDIRPYLAISDVFVFPSYREGFPNVVLQAGSMGLPCIVTDINGSNEIIIEGKNGCVIPSKNINSLVSSMESFIDNPLYVENLSDNARELIVSRYQQQFVWDCILEEYQKALKNV